MAATSANEGSSAWRQRQLPEFEKPPVVETVLAVHFKPLPELDSVAMIRFWQQRLQDELPLVEERDRFDVPVERFDEPGTFGMGLILGSAPTPRRFWFSSKDARHLVQIQQDWFAFNWRKQARGTYERYVGGLSNFRRFWTEFSEFVGEENLGRLAPQQCEVTYVNHIVAGEGWTHHGELSNILRLAGQPSPNKLPMPERHHASATYPIGAPSPFGRLHVTCDATHAVTDEHPVPMFVLTLTARGNPTGQTIDGIVDFLDIGHQWIVGAFDELTTERMHRIWRRRERRDG